LILWVVREIGIPHLGIKKFPKSGKEEDDGEDGGGEVQGMCRGGRGVKDRGEVEALSHSHELAFCLFVCRLLVFLCPLLLLPFYLSLQWLHWL